MELADTLNKIRWQFYMRFPGGGIYDKCIGRIKDKDASELLELFNGSYLNISVLKMYLFGYYSIDKKDIYRFYQKLFKLDCVHQINVNNTTFIFFDIGDDGLIIKAPNFSNIEELACFRFELLDLIFPYLITDIKGFKNLSFNEGPYEYLSKKVDIRLKPGDTVFDLGANFGLFTAYAASVGCNVYAFEPLNSAISNYLVHLKEFYPNIHIVASAVSDKLGYALLNVDKNNFGASYLSSTSGIEVPVTTIDAFVEQNNIQKVDFIKADIEGSECCMLDGAVNTLQHFAPELSLCRYHHLGDSQKIRKKILNANPRYTIDTRWKKIYAKIK